MNFEESKIYQETLKELTKYHKEPEGFTSYEGVQLPDKHYPKILNCLLGLIVSLHHKVDAQAEQIKQLLSQKTQEDSKIADEVMLQLSRLSIGDNPPLRKQTDEWYFF